MHDIEYETLLIRHAYWLARAERSRRIRAWLKRLWARIRP